MQSSMWSFLQKKEGGEIEDLQKKIDESSKANDLKNKKSPTNNNNNKNVEKELKKSSKKKKVEEEDEDIQEEDIQVEQEEEQEEEEEIKKSSKNKKDKKEKKENNKKNKKSKKSVDIDDEEEMEEEKEDDFGNEEGEEEEMDLDDNEKEKKNKKSSSSDKNKKKDKKETKEIKATKKKKEEKPSQLKRLKRKTMDDDNNEEEEKNDDLDDLLDDEQEKERNKSTGKEKEKEKQAVSFEKVERKKQESPTPSVEKEKEKETISVEKAEDKPVKKDIDINDLFKKAAEYAKSNGTNNNNKKQKTQHNNNNKSPVKSSPVTTTATTTSPKSPVKNINNASSTTTTTTTTTTTITTTTISTSPKKQQIEKKVEQEKEKEKENNKVEEDKEIEKEIENEEDLIEEYEDEEYEYEEGSDQEDGGEEENKNSISTSTSNKKTVFVKKVPISKIKGTIKTIQNDLKVIAKYNPIDDAMWKKGQSLPYMALAKTFETIESYSSRLIIIEHLTNLFRSIMLLSPKDLVKTIYLSINKIGPSYQAKELGIGDHILVKAVAESCGRSVDAIKQELVNVGDLGIIAQNARMTQPTMFPLPPLTIESVFRDFKSIADLSGTGGQKKKTDLIKKLLTACKDCESLYIIRSLQGKLRIGLAERSVLMALTKAVLVTPPTTSLNDPTTPPKVLDIRKTMKTEEFEELYTKAVQKVTRAYSQLPNYDLFVPHLIEQNGLEDILKTCSLKVGIPVKPMLAQPTTGITQMLDRFTDMEFTCEFKYDGERAQIHCLENGQVSIYTRNLEDYTQKYPDIIANVKKFIGPNVTSFILDCEAVAFDPNTKKILSFQVLSTRARKSVQLEQIKVPVCVFAFDLLFLNGQSLIDEPLYRRREIMVENFVASEGVFSFAKYANISDVNDIQSYLEEAVEGNCEGLMVKTLKEKSIYEPSRRSYNWLKIKKDYMQGMTDSLDLVPIGAWYGKGKRTGTYGAYLLACYDEDNEEFQTLCKIGTGFSDEQLTKFTNELKPHAINQPRNMYRIADSIKPDVWLSPSQVWEVLAADLSISPVHTAAFGNLESNKGIALRFPRFIRVRDDKNPEDATSSEQVVLMYQNQKINNNNSNSKQQDDEDY